MFAVLGSQKIIYKKPLKRWTKFNITLVLEGWDEKWVYHRQIFEQRGEVCAIGFTKLAFWHNRSTQNMRKILADSGVIKTEMNPPPETLDIFENDYAMLKKEVTQSLTTPQQM